MCYARYSLSSFLSEDYIRVRRGKGMVNLEFNMEACKSCGFCVKVCPKQVLAIGDGINRKGYRYVQSEHPDECIGCKMCAVMCPDVVIEISK
jgi:2-oxoglutarate ferredoxin oxidoreductase subunit delta